MRTLDEVVAALVAVPRNIDRTVQMFRYRTFADACLASCALVANAGPYDVREHYEMQRCIKDLPEFQAFNATALLDDYSAYKRRTSQADERIELLKIIRRLSNEKLARRVVNIAADVVAAKHIDLDLTDSEKTTLEEITRELGLRELAD